MTQPGYVYVLEPRGIEAGVCKIGRTTVDVRQRVAQYNSGSNGNILWDIHDHVATSDCVALEAEAHRRLHAVRQDGREIFACRANEAMSELRSILTDIPGLAALCDTEHRDGKKERITVYVRGDVYAQAKAATLELGAAGLEPDSVSALIDAALERELSRLARKHRDGEPWPMHRGRLPGGRPRNA